MKKPVPNPDNGHVVTFILIGLVVLTTVLLIIALMASRAKATEYSQISEANLNYCDLYARNSALNMPGMMEAYNACISILPTRLPMPTEPGTAPAVAAPAGGSAPGWSDACEAEYRSWDAATGTVVRRGSPDRVECPLTLIDGVWGLPVAAE